MAEQVRPCTVSRPASRIGKSARRPTSNASPWTAYGNRRSVRTRRPLRGILSLCDDHRAILVTATGQILMAAHTASRRAGKRDSGATADLAATVPVGGFGQGRCCATGRISSVAGPQADGRGCPVPTTGREAFCLSNRFTGTPGTCRAVRWRLRSHRTLRVAGRWPRNLGWTARWAGFWRWTGCRPGRAP